MQFLNQKFPHLQDTKLNVRLKSSSIFEIGKKYQSLAFSGSFAVKNDNFRFFFAVLVLNKVVSNYEFAGFASKQKYTAWTVSTETVHTAKSRLRKNQSERCDFPKTGFGI